MAKEEIRYELRPDPRIGADPSRLRLVRVTGSDVTGRHATWISEGLTREQWMAVAALVCATPGCVTLTIEQAEWVRERLTQWVGWPSGWPLGIGAAIAPDRMPAPAPTAPPTDEERADAYAESDAMAHGYRPAPAAPAQPHPADEDLRNRREINAVEEAAVPAFRHEPAPDEGAVEALALVIASIRCGAALTREQFAVMNILDQRECRLEAAAALSWADRRYGGEVAALRALLVRARAHVAPSPWYGAVRLLSDIDAALALTSSSAAAAVTALARAAHDAEVLLGEIAAWVSNYDDERDDPSFQRVVCTLYAMEVHTQALRDKAAPFTTARGGGGQ